MTLQTDIALVFVPKGATRIGTQVAIACCDPNERELWIVTGV
jgi:hypothetical protein